MVTCSRALKAAFVYSDFSTQSLVNLLLQLEFSYWLPATVHNGKSATITTTNDVHMIIIWYMYQNARVMQLRLGLKASLCVDRSWAWRRKFAALRGRCRRMSTQLVTSHAMSDLNSQLPKASYIFIPCVVLSMYLKLAATAFLHQVLSELLQHN